MNGLILKDFYVLTKQIKFFLVMVIIFAIMPQYSMSAFAIVYSSMLPITTMGYDERAKWDQFAAMLPYSRKDIVLSKYLLGYISVFATFLLSIIGKIGYSIYSDSGIDIILILAQLFPLICVGIIIQSINLPIMFKMGVEKGRLIFILLTVVIVFGLINISDNLITVLETADKLLNSLLLLAAITVLISIISIPISISLYKKREF